ncbi:hypothetical protein H8L32_26225 [Undibacterium sp. CY18W]|uniref:Uncharacterized protein n=1 Tax=Undibacterium hunanense TaxID=2762292 RepID=A0ABR6ZYM7_9BURK|nr:hypothetical protein [Undibacterium hunanense]MBC3920988.1 hypothetical protein [Undibacterium hunanense]
MDKMTSKLITPQCIFLGQIPAGIFILLVHIRTMLADWLHTSGMVQLLLSTKRLFGRLFSGSPQIIIILIFRGWICLFPQQVKAGNHVRDYWPES